MWIYIYHAAERGVGKHPDSNMFRKYLPTPTLNDGQKKVNKDQANDICIEDRWAISEMQIETMIQKLEEKKGNRENKTGQNDENCFE